MGILNRLSRIFARLVANRPMVIQTGPDPAPEPKVKVYGSQGRLEINELGISVPLYDTSRGDAQKLVDDVDSAAYLRWGTQVAVADHACQANFANLSRAVPGRTIAVIDRKTSQEQYMCYRTQVGHIRIIAPGNNNIYDANWAPVKTQNAGGLTIYTCMGKSAEDVMDIRLTYWKKVNPQ